LRKQSTSGFAGPKGRNRPKKQQFDAENERPKTKKVTMFQRRGDKCFSPGKLYRKAETRLQFSEKAPEILQRWQEEK